MPKIIKNFEVVEDDWTLVETADWDAVHGLPGGPVIVPATLWLSHSADLNHEAADVGIWLNSDEHPEIIRDHIQAMTLIAINFPDFNDGRGYSYARILREQFGYAGELRAIGDVLQDQLQFMYRCGFDSFAVRADKDPHVALTGLTDFRNAYQPATRNIGSALVYR